MPTLPPDLFVWAIIIALGSFVLYFVIQSRRNDKNDKDNPAKQ